MVLIRPLHGFPRPRIHPRPQDHTYCKRVARCKVAICTRRPAKPAAIGPGIHCNSRWGGGGFKPIPPPRLLMGSRRWTHQMTSHTNSKNNTSNAQRNPP